MGPDSNNGFAEKKKTAYKITISEVPCQRWRPNNQLPQSCDQVVLMTFQWPEIWGQIAHWQDFGNDLVARYYQRHGRTFQDLSRVPEDGKNRPQSTQGTYALYR